MAETGPIETDRLIIEPFGENRLGAALSRLVARRRGAPLQRATPSRPHSPVLQEYRLSFRGTPHFFWAVVSRDRPSGISGI